MYQSNNIRMWQYDITHKNFLNIYQMLQRRFFTTYHIFAFPSWHEQNMIHKNIKNFIGVFGTCFLSSSDSISEGWDITRMCWNKFFLNFLIHFSCLFKNNFFLLQKWAQVIFLHHIRWLFNPLQTRYIEIFVIPW